MNPSAMKVEQSFKFESFSKNLEHFGSTAIKSSSVKGYIYSMQTMTLGAATACARVRC
jgi:hypothetical protein